MELILILLCTVFISSGFVSCDRAQKYNRSEAYARSLKIQCPENQTFCEQVPNYPSNIIREVMKKNPAFLHSYFHWSTTKKPERTYRDVSSDTDDNPNSCEVTRSVTYPTLMKNTDGEVKNIVNNEYYWQPVTRITCKEENSGCDRGKRSFFGLLNNLGGNGNFQRKCIQKYKNVELITYDPVKWSGEYNSFKIPSGCECAKTKS